MSFDLHGRVIVITGAAGLLGSQYTRALCAEGAVVVAADIDRDAAERLVAGIDGGQAVALEVDITRPEHVRAMVKEVVRRFDRIDGLVNNAALDPKFDEQHEGEHTVGFENLPIGQWEAALGVNLTGAFLCAQAVAPVMLRQESGSIVNISSIYGMVGPDQRLYAAAESSEPTRTKPVTYTVTKAGIIGLTKYLAAYWRGKGIRVNTLTLGGVYNGHDEEFVRRYSARTLLGRMAQPDEYCGALVFLLSEASSYMTGANLVIDGGWTAW